MLNDQTLSTFAEKCGRGFQPLRKNENNALSVSVSHKAFAQGLEAPATKRLAAVLLTTLAIAGCDISDGDSTPTGRDHEPIRDTRPAPASGVPRNTSVAASGRGAIAFKAQRDCTAYVWDDDSSTLLLTQRVRRGETLRVSPEENRIFVDDKKVSDDDLKKSDVHRIYVEPPERRENEYEFGSRPPSSANVVAEGWGDLYWTAPVDGVVYVVDDSQGVVLRQPITSRNEVAILSGRGVVTIDGRRVYDRLPRDNRHSVYFEGGRSSRPDDRGNRGDDAVPRDAENVAEGRGEVLSFKPKRDGRYWVIDADANRAIFGGRIRANQRFTLDPTRDAGVIDGRKVVDQPLSKRVTYRLLYQKG